MVDVGPYRSTHRFCEEEKTADVVSGCRKRTLNERVNGWLVKMASVEVTFFFTARKKRAAASTCRPMPINS